MTEKIQKETSLLSVKLFLYHRDEGIRQLISSFITLKNFFFTPQSEGYDLAPTRLCDILSHFPPNIADIK